MNAVAEIVLGVISILIAIIGFFLAHYFKQSVKSQDELRESVNKLQITLTGLNGIIIAMQEKSDIFSEGCKSKHDIVNHRLNEHARQIDEHEKKIAELAVKVDYLE